DTATTEIYTLSLHDALPIFDIPNGYARPILRKFMRQPLLNVEIDIIPLPLPVPDTGNIRDVGKKRSGIERGLRPGIRHSGISPIQPDRLVSRYIAQHLHLSVRPFHQYRI